jgi:two-component system sensor histidine kinase KdpD
VHSGDADSARRPSPEALLAAAVREQRSRLKVFVGAAPGVGKTFAMLQAARERLHDGTDVVVGVVETHGRAETEALLDGLEVIPRQALHYRGQTLAEMDIDAILARRPRVVLVDELAHTNAPGSRHSKRFLDVEELLDAGIEVYSTVNIQHLESLNDVVAQITGVRVRETVPDRILDRADEVKLIDLSPEELIQRLRDGKVYVPQQAERALRNYFQPGNLTALRELALRETAEHVDEQMQAHMRAHAVDRTWPVTERLMVAVRGGAMCERLVRRTRRMAERRNAPWIAVFVEPTGFDQRPEPERVRLAKVLRLAEQLGGEAVTIPGDRVAEDLLRFARERNVTEIVVGGPLRARWWDRWRQSPVDALIRDGVGIDVRVVSHEREDEEPPPSPAPRPVLKPQGYIAALAAVAGATLVSAGLMAVLPLSDPGMVFLVGVLVSAVVGGLGPGIAAAVASVLVYDFLFLPPFYSLSITKPQDGLSLATFLVAAVLTSNLMARVRDQAAAARRREARTAALYAFARAIAGAADLNDLIRVIAGHVGTLFDTQVAVLLPDGDRLSVRASHPDGTDISEAERGTATWAWKHDQPAGSGTDTLPGGDWLHVPLGTVRGAAGVLALRVHDIGLDQRQLLDALAGQAAVGIERTRIDAVLEAQAKTEAIIESIEDGLVVLDPDGRVAHVNEVACAILSFERADALGRPFAQLGTSHSHYLRLRAAVTEFLAHPEREHQPVELALFLRGRDHHYILRPTPLRALDGAPAGLILVLQDVTYLRDQEARREQLMATLSHELRTPLTSLRMAVELLARGQSDPKPLIETAGEDVARLEDVTQRLLDVSRSRAMSIALERRRVDLADVVARVGRLFALQARERGVTLDTRADEDAHLAGDPTKLTWALSNLIANALRYTPSGGKVGVEVTTDGDVIRLTVSDTGPGIEPERQERIFERFVGGDDGGAAGLGLAIVRDIVQAHGGRIFLDSAPGRGSRFTLELPRR